MNDVQEKKESPLASLLTDKAEVQSYTEQILSEILGTFVELEKDTGKPYLKAAFYEVPAIKQIAVLLCAQMARHILGFVDKSGLTQSEISEALPNIPVGTIKGSLNRLRSERLVIKSGGVNMIDQRQLKHLKKIVETN